MSLTIETLANYLGREASTLLGDPPFKNWTFEKSFENDLEKPLIDYVFAQDGFDFVCDDEDKVQSIFLYCDESRRFDEGVQDLPFTSSRQVVIACLGPPSKSGGKVTSRILGECGAWDRFARPEYAIHVEYRLNADIINKITLMRADVVPS
jgi:hypothetical protein